MGNNLSVDPAILDSAGSGIGAARLHIIKSIEWVAPAAVGDQAYLLAADGAVLCDFTCDIALKNQMKSFGGKGHPFTGPFTLSILDSGKLLVIRV